MQLWGDGQVCELLPRADDKNRLEAKQLADKQEKEEGYAPLMLILKNILWSSTIIPMDTCPKIGRASCKCP